MKFHEQVDAALARLVGKKITQAEREIRDMHGEPYDRMEAIYLTVEGVGRVEISYWAEYAGDASLEIAIEPEDGE